MFQVKVMAFGTTPGIIHGHGYHAHKPLWKTIREAYFAAPQVRAILPSELTIVTCNNGHPSMGCFEHSLAKMGLACHVCGQEIENWVNSKHKPAVLASALRSISTKYTLYADSRDAILIQKPGVMLERYLSKYSCKILFGGDRMSYPSDAACKAYEDSLSGAAKTEFRYLNGGAWLGETRFAESFFELATRIPPMDIAPNSEQGILRRLIPHFEDEIQIDHRCEIFLNAGFVFNTDAISLEHNDNCDEVPNYSKFT